VIGGNILDLEVRKHPFHGEEEPFPLIIAVEVVHHEESAAQQVLAHVLGFVLVEVPAAHFHTIDKRELENVELSRILRATRPYRIDIARIVLVIAGIDGIDARETTDAAEEVVLRLGRIGCPGAASSAETPAAEKPIVLGQARKDEFGLGRAQAKGQRGTAGDRSGHEAADGQRNRQAEMLAMLPS
jgi:hypothetical protein